MLQSDEKLVRSRQVAEQEIAIEDNAPSQGYPLFSIESGEITEIENTNIYLPHFFVAKIFDFHRIVHNKSCMPNLLRFKLVFRRYIISCMKSYFHIFFHHTPFLLFHNCIAQHACGIKIFHSIFLFLLMKCLFIFSYSYEIIFSFTILYAYI